MGTCTSTPTDHRQVSNMNPLPSDSYTNDIGKGCIQTFNTPCLQDDISLQPPHQSVQSSLVSNSSTISNSDTYVYSTKSFPKLLYSMNTNNLALLVRYIIENEPLFDKYKHKSDIIYNAFINYHIKGKMVRKLSRAEFAHELQGIRSVISVKLYIWLKSLSDDEIINILTNIKHEEFELEQLSKDTSQITTYTDINTPTPDIIPIQLPIYLTQHHNNISNKFSQDVIDQLVALGYGTHEECIQASRLTNNYHDINEVINTFDRSVSHLQNNDTEIDFMYDEKAFQIFVYSLCVDHNFDEIIIEMLLKALMDICMNGSQFMSLKKIEFCKMLKKYQIKAGFASKVYKLIMDNNENINVPLSFVDQCENEKQSTYCELAKLSVSEFQICAYNMLELINENMKMNMVNGLSLFEHYKSKQSLKMYLEENITCKSINILADLLWDDYMRDTDKINRKVISYSRKQILKYFIALYHYHVKEVIIKNNLTYENFVSLKRKGICKIFIDECGFSIGVSTNIVDKIYAKIKD